jgi:hypothetical protein
MAVLSSFLRNLHTVFLVFVLICIPTNNVKEFLCTASSPAFVIITLDYGHSIGGEMKSTVVVICISFIAREVECFMYLLVICTSSFENS